MPQTIYEMGGQGSIIHLAVANGFPPRTYQSLLMPLTTTYRVISLPPRALWDDPPPPERLRSWHELADDLLAALDAYAIEPVIGLGHSFGGVVSLVAAAQHPQRFRALILLDPTIFMSWQFWSLAAMRALGLQMRMPLVRGALNRRARFDSIDEAYSYWRGKRLFHDWSDDAVRLYADSITRPRSDGQGLELVWLPAWEARYYQTILTTTWHYLGRLRGRLPILTIRGERSDTLTQAVFAKMQRVLPDMSQAEIAGHGHLFPLSAPDATRQVIEAWLRAQKL
jgi:pimeloyl-ACP methyl ester carboxylesterase